ncbi:hypothetical protein KAR91_11970 [Candidatus Pacearchaeota archaeon]|nr:hypothetical protein [Candidatus Pacearchaeota archaeon]
MAGSSVTWSGPTRIYKDGEGRNVDLYSAAIVADDTDGSVPSTGTGGKIIGEVMMAEFVNTDLDEASDIVINDALGNDIFGAELANIPAQAKPKIGSAYGDRPVWSKLTLVLTNNATNDAEGTLYLVVRAAKYL